MEKRYCYEIWIEGDLGQQWAEWFGGLAIQPGPKGETILRGRIADQAALMGTLNKIHSLNLLLISVARIDESGK